MASSRAPIHRRSGSPVAAGGSAWLAWLLLGAAALLAVPHPDGRVRATTPAADPALPPPTLTLQVTPGGYALDGRPANRAVVERALRDARGRAPNLRLRIDADAGDPGQLIGALALAEHAGIRNVGSPVR